MKDVLTNILLTLVIVYITFLICSKFYNIHISGSNDKDNCNYSTERGNDKIYEPYYDVPLEPSTIPMHYSSNNVASASVGPPSNPSPSIKTDTPSQSESEAKSKGHVRFDMDNIVHRGADMTPEINNNDMESVDVKSAWEDARGNQPKKENKEDLKIQEMLRHTLRDGVKPTEDNIIAVSQKVKDAYTAPSASDIRSSSARSRDMMPEITSSKLDGNVDFAMTYMYKDRAPVTTISEVAESVQWGATDAYEYRKKNWAQR